MTTYVDDMRAPFKGYVMCHMVADSDVELHIMAEALGLKREWHQAPPKASHSHYDIARTKRTAALKIGAVAVTQKQLACMVYRRKITGELGSPHDAIEWRHAYVAARRSQD